ncbi:MAG TPA: hypothetical protein VJ276_18370 [Thermoanaerobaculia bacterium]|nr:hypothetical protein [Thermoanaerobaculia bacterium]
MSIALVTWAGLPHLSDDDRLLQQAMTGARAVVWDDPTVDWSSFDEVILRSTWDYHKRVDEFRAWVERVPRLWNPREVVLWNLHKKYLLDYEQIVPTALVPAGASAREAAEARGWTKVVVKPAVSATAWRTELVDARDAGVHDVDVLVQPYMEEIEDGEWSLVFFGGEYSHAVLKRPRKGDFRVQSDFGGSAALRIPDARIIEQAAKLVKPDWLYARVDGIERGGRFLLMELELTEPALFFGADPAAPARFLAALDRIRRGSEVLHGCP